MADIMLLTASIGFLGLVGAWGWILAIWIAAIIALVLLVFFVLKFGQRADEPLAGEVDPLESKPTEGRPLYRPHRDTSNPFPPSAPREKPTTLEEFKEVALVIARSKHFFPERTDKEILDNLKYEITPDEYRMLLHHTNFEKEIERLREEYPSP
ncbi:MAG: hypothetical protein K9M98_12515 [Cephaloticoccus sp.]|nr:hypothetical protein [Cephaloticoccus sp.]MCF7761317.1 hypothetical protein [Cephaloticoccus sp.]